MKYLIVVTFTLAAFVAAADDEWKPSADTDFHRKVQQDCVKESGLTNQQLEEIKKVKLPDEKEVRDYTYCYVKKIGIFTDQRGYIGERVVAQLSAMDLATAKVRAAVAKCADNTDAKEEPAVRAFRGVQCLMNNHVEGLQEKIHHH